MNNLGVSRKEKRKAIVAALGGGLATGAGFLGAVLKGDNLIKRHRHGQENVTPNDAFNPRWQMQRLQQEIEAHKLPREEEMEVEVEDYPVQEILDNRHFDQWKKNWLAWRKSRKFGRVHKHKSMRAYRGRKRFAYGRRKFRKSRFSRFRRRRRY